MNVYVMVNVTHVMVYVYLFGVRNLLYLQYANWWLEVDCGVDKPNSFDDDPHDTIDQGNWILPLHFYLYPNNAYNNVYFFGYCIIWWDLPK
jgi:hypothetical protein